MLERFCDSHLLTLCPASEVSPSNSQSRRTQTLMLGWSDPKGFLRRFPGRIYPKLLRLAIMKFPHLSTVLHIHRCQSAGGEGLKVVSLSTVCLLARNRCSRYLYHLLSHPQKDLAHAALASLGSLRTLKLYVDFAGPDNPQPRRFMPTAPAPRP